MATAKKPGVIRINLTGNVAEDGRFRELVEDLRIPISCPLLQGQWLEATETQGAIPVGSTAFYLAVRAPLTRSIALKTGVSNVIAHRLGRAVEGFLVVSKSAQADVWQTDPTTITPASTATEVLVLECSADVTVKVWVF